MSDSARVAARSHSPPSLLGLATGGSQRGDRSPGRESRDDAWRDVLRGTTHGDDAPYKASSRSSSHRVVESCCRSARRRQRRHSFRFNFFLLAPYSSSSSPRTRARALLRVAFFLDLSPRLIFFSCVGFSQSPAARFFFFLSRCCPPLIRVSSPARHPPLSTDPSSSLLIYLPAPRLSRLRRASRRANYKLSY